MIELGLCLAALSARPLADAFTLAAELGLLAVDLPADRRLGLIDPTLVPGDAACDKLRTELREAGLRVLAVSESTECRMLLGPYGGFADAGFDGTINQARDHALATGRRAIELAAALGAPYVRLFLGCPGMERWLTWHGVAASWADQVAEFLQRADPLLAHADANQVQLVMEPHPKQVAYDADSLITLLEACNNRIGVCLDPANLLALGHDPVRVVRALPAPPAMVQAKDVERAGGGQPAKGAGWVRYGPQPAVRFRAAGWGEVRWRELLSALADRGYDGAVLIEHEDLLASPEEGIAAAAGFLAPLTRPITTGGSRTW